MKTWAFFAVLAVLAISRAPVSAQVTTPPLMVASEASEVLPALEAPVGEPSKAAPYLCCMPPREKVCKWTLANLFRSLLVPIRILTGHANRTVVEAAAAAPAPLLSPENMPLPVLAATKIKADEDCAGLRLAAVRYLGSTDCHFYPEAEEALLAALRGDRNEWVRLEAAQALGNGFCCTPRAIEKLNMVVKGSDADGNPGENSQRVKAAALASLRKCLAQHDCDQGCNKKFESPMPQELPEKSSRERKRSPVRLSGYQFTADVEAQRTEIILTQARRTIAELASATPPARIELSAPAQEDARRTPATDAEAESGVLTDLGLTPIGRIPPGQ